MNNEFFFDMQSFDKKKSRWGFWKIATILIVVLVLFVALAATFKQHGQGHTKIVMVSVHKFSGEDDNYMCYDYKIDSVTKCLTFEDNFGIGRTICNNYTISTIGK